MLVGLENPTAVNKPGANSESQASAAATS